MVMGHRLVNITLPEAREPLPDFLVRQNTDAERRLTFDILVECDLGTGQQADRNVRLSDRRESASNRIVEFRRSRPRACILIAACRGAVCWREGKEPRTTPGG